jgi:hypothetical protein
LLIAPPESLGGKPSSDSPEVVFTMAVLVPWKQGGGTLGESDVQNATGCEDQ